MSHERPNARIQEASRGMEWRIFVNNSYRTTKMSESEAREWCKSVGIDANRIEVVH